MKFDFNVYYYDYHNRIRNLDTQAQGEVKSNKFFPVFLEDGKERIFKPLSKTKPLCTPYFAYAEVFWSTIINQYFDSKTPIYKLAICKHIEEDFESKYDHGVIVDSLAKPNYKLVNLYEIFRDSPDPSVDISKYINYCEVFYDYSCIFNSKLMRENKNLVESFAMQVLLSILKLDQNYHYENPLFYKYNGEIKEIAPMIDHEFSSMFLYMDNLDKNRKKLNDGLSSLILKPTPNDILSMLLYENYPSLSRNLDIIIDKYKNTSKEFLENLKCFIKDFESQAFLLEDYGYITPFNSYNFEVGNALYKNKDLNLAEKLRSQKIQYSPDICDISNIIYNEVILSSKILENEIEKRLIKK